ncbi:hypothetical protein A9Q90_09295 [Gammaproteobacteria bacterium 54_18_T64]|nr:hypothetical protein A9Q90_09295 [Gammaproteobacteria bacterium 54_18_T64]
MLFPLHSVAGGSAAESAEKQGARQYVLKARQQQTWLRPEWRVLLHYSPALLTRGERSLVDDSEFFLAPNGKHSRQAELEATLEAFFSSEEDNDQALACRFPARLAWLRRTLDIDETRLPAYQCPALHKWLRKLNADGLSLIFPAALLNSPASMFGHTFLRLDRKAAQKPDLLAWTLNFAAHAGEGRGLGFAYKGLSGAYPGRFTLAPYYQRVKAYSEIENRDIWEYELNYSPQEVRFMLLHLWELLPAYFDYYFIDENCSYHLLALLEVAKPQLNVSQNFYWDATPADTVRALANVPGLIKKVKYRPSLRRHINARVETMSFADQHIAKSLALGELPLTDEKLAVLSPSSQVEVLELAAAYLAYVQASSHQREYAIDDLPVPVSRGSQRQRDRQHHLLTARSAMTAVATPVLVQEPAYRPDQGHGGRRMGWRYGTEASKDYLQFDFRWAYHDLYDPDNGFIKGAQLEFLKPSLRYYPASQNLQLESLDFVDIISAPARTYFIRPFSWRASAALQRYQLEDDERPLLGVFKGGLGLSYAFNKQGLASIFANSQLLTGAELAHGMAFGLGVSAEMTYTMGDKWKAGFYTQLLQYVEGQSETTYQVGGRLRFSVDQESAVLFELTQQRQFSSSFLQAQLSWQGYF